MNNRVIILVLGSVVLAGCDSGDKSDWQQKYADCKVLASVMDKGKSSFLKPPDCDRIPKLCSKDAKSSACVDELKQYFRK